jgi:EmrB/QacA subfamily drug resistance transporter
VSVATVGRSRNLVLAAMIFAVSMTFIDQTIVSIAAPEVQRRLGLTSTGVQWAVNAYLLSLAALFAFGGRLADTVGHRRMVTLGVVLFATASALCGLTPKGGLAEAWIVAFRVLQGAGGAIMFPAALAIVVQTFALRERGRALAVFFGIAGGLTAVGPILGGYLTQWTWRAIFWVNVPVAVIALALIAISKPVTEHRRAPMDYRGVAVIAAGVALSVFGFQESAVWGWSNPATGLCIAAGAAILVAFYFMELRTTSPLIQVSIFRIRAFLVENLVLGIAMLVFIPVFFFASEYAQLALGKSPSAAGLYILYFFIGFVIAAQIGGRLLDRDGAKRPVVLGCTLAAVGFYLWAGNVTGLDFSTQQLDIVIAGAGMGLMLGPANTDAINRASALSYGEATGVTQTVRNYAASLGLAVLGTILVSRLRARVAGSLIAAHVPQARAHALASKLAQSRGAGVAHGAIPHFVRLDFAYATRSVLYVMAAIMALAAIVAFLGLQAGRQEEPQAAGADASPAAPGPEAAGPAAGPSETAPGASCAPGRLLH